MRFIAGFAVPYVVIAAWAMITHWAFMRYEMSNWAYFLAWCVAAPVGAAWFTYEFTSMLRPRRVFDRRVGRHVRSVLSGLVAGVLAAAMTVTALVALDVRDLTYVYLDPFMFGAAAIVASMIVLLVLRPIRAGRCVRCGYDVQGLTCSRCPECGLLLALGSSDRPSAAQSACADRIQTPRA